MICAFSLAKAVLVSAIGGHLSCQRTWVLARVPGSLTIRREVFPALPQESPDRLIEFGGLYSAPPPKPVSFDDDLPSPEVAASLPAF